MGPTDNLNINKRGVQIKRGGGSLITNYGCPKPNFFAPYLDKVDTGANITLNEIRKANKSNFTITQSRNIQINVFETSDSAITNLY